MKRVFVSIFALTLVLFALASCDIINGFIGDDNVDDGGACAHEWADATCKTPKTCTKCGEISGAIGDHDYSEATCTSPQTCKTCGIWYGLALGHDYADANCTDPQICKVCAKTRGEPKHEFENATCTSPATCSLCGFESGKALGHSETTVVTAPSCTLEGSEIITCTVCDAVIKTTLIPKEEHNNLSFVYNGDATFTNDGTMTAACPHCEYSVTETLEGSAAIIRDAFVGKKISILGDSISTYLNISGGTAADTTNSTIKNNLLWYGYQPSQPAFGGTSADSTWWQRTINALGASRLVNNSNSGESVFNALQDRCMQLHDDTGDNAGETPDIIFIYLGTNDCYRKMGSAALISMDAVKEAAADTSFTPKDLAMAYAVMLYRVQTRYPDAEIYCLTNVERSDVDEELTHAVSEVIREVVELFDGIHLADICLESGIDRSNPDYHYYIPNDQGGKSIHPGVNGMAAISRVLMNSILENSRYLPDEFKEIFAKIDK